MLSLVVIGLILAIDILSKYWVHIHFPLMLAYPQYPYGGIGVFKNFLGIEFSISHLTNRGAAWGALSNFQDALVGLRIILIISLCIYAIYWNTRPSWRIPLALIIAGAIGNVIDYFAYGHVVDMIHFVLWGYDFPVFNIADSAVSIGVFWLILISAFEQQEDKQKI